MTDSTEKTPEQLRADLMARLIDDPKGQRIALAALMATVAAETERCAKAADEAAELWRPNTPGRRTAEAIAAAIRERRP